MPIESEVAFMSNGEVLVRFSTLISFVVKGRNGQILSCNVKSVRQPLLTLIVFQITILLQAMAFIYIQLIIRLISIYKANDQMIPFRTV